MAFATTVLVLGCALGFSSALRTRDHQNREAIDVTTADEVSSFFSRSESRTTTPAEIKGWRPKDHDEWHRFMMERAFNTMDAPVIFQMGACDKSCGASPGGEVVWPRLKDKKLKAAVLLEPNPDTYKKLQAHVEEEFGADSKVKAVQEAVCETSGTMPFYSVSERLGQDHPQTPDWMRYQINSMDYDKVYLHKGEAKDFGLTVNEFESYIDKIDVKCSTPQDIVAASQLSPESVDVLAIDTEGFDYKVLKGFLGIAKFRPKLIVFEAHNLKNDEKKGAWELLTKLGYHTDATTKGEFDSIKFEWPAMAQIFAWRPEAVDLTGFDAFTDTSYVSDA